MTEELDDELRPEYNLDELQPVPGGRGKYVRRMILDYEIRASWRASWISWGPLQALTARYFAWKVKRKFTRYQNSMAEKKRVAMREKPPCTS